MYKYILNSQKLFLHKFFRWHKHLSKSTNIISFLLSLFSPSSVKSCFLKLNIFPSIFSSIFVPSSYA